MSVNSVVVFLILSLIPGSSRFKRTYRNTSDQHADASLSIQALLGAPNPDDPLANDVAQNWKDDEKAAIAQAREWTRVYAN